MIQPLDASDMAILRPVQKAAIYEALFMIIAIDREIKPDEIVHFDIAVMQIPWGLDMLMLELVRDKARMRVKSTLSRDAWFAWIKEIALLVSVQPLREKVIRTMGQMAMRCGTAKEPPVRPLLNEFIREFDLSPQAIDELRSELLPIMQT